MSKIDIIINCYNGEKYLDDTLKSIKNQTIDDYEIIFIDNCSTDRSAKIAKSFGNKLKYYKTEENIPLGKARNFALGKCKSDYICFIDSDDLWEPTKLETQLSSFKKNNYNISATNYYLLNMIDSSKEIFFKKSNDKIIKFGDFAINYQYALSSFMFKKSVVESYNIRFDDDLSFAEEYDFFLKIALHGDVYYIDKPLCTYRIHPDMTSKKIKESIPKEYDAIIKNLLSLDESVFKKFPNIYKYLIFQRDFTQTKIFIEKKENRKARKIIRKYKFKKKGFLFWILSFLPKRLSYKIYCKKYRKKI